MDIEVTRDDAKKRYSALLDGHEAYISYREVGPHTLDFQHTLVAPDVRGRGVADALVRHALQDARARGFRVIPTCSFVRAFIERHPEFKELTASG